MLSNSKKFKLLFVYFTSSIKTYSTWFLIIFNLLILYGFIRNGLSLGQVVLSYIVQISISILFFVILVFSFKKFKTREKTYSGKGVKTALFIFGFFMWVFYGAAIYILGLGTLYSGTFVSDINKLELGFFIGILVAFFSIILNFIANFATERKRLENTELIKVFFEPAGNIFPIYLSILVLAIFRDFDNLLLVGCLVIIIKTLADIIINSPLNAENPFIYQLLRKY